MIFRLRDFILYPGAIWRHHNLLLESQRWSPEARRGYVQERLERTLEHAVKNVPFYRRTLGAYQSRFKHMVDRLDLSELPVLTKEEVRNHYEELCAENASDFRPVPTRTSGSTGTPTRFLLDADSISPPSGASSTGPATHLETASRI
jgi:phenylacetate-CoA ligase